MEISEVALPSGGDILGVTDRQTACASGDILGVTDRQTAGASGWPAFVFRRLKLLFTFLFLTPFFVSLLLFFACLLLPYIRTR